jgi:hypothetical protein
MREHLDHKVTIILISIFFFDKSQGNYYPIKTDYFLHLVLQLIRWWIFI